MAYKKLSDLPASSGRDLLIIAQQRGVQMIGPISIHDAPLACLIGLADMLAKGEDIKVLMAALKRGA